MFTLKAILMLVFPFYRVMFLPHAYPPDILYSKYQNGTVAHQKLLAYNDQTYVKLRALLTKEKNGWRYDLVTYAPVNLFSSSILKVNCLNKRIVVNYERNHAWTQISKDISCPSP